MDNESRSKSVAKGKRKPARRDPEKRRKQNILAQRKYRKCMLARHPVENILMGCSFKEKSSGSDWGVSKLLQHL